MVQPNEEFKKEVKIYLEELKEKYPEEKKVFIEYTGYGDSINDICCDRENINLNDFDELIEYVWAYLGTSLNDGGAQGSLLIDLEKLTLKVEDSWNYTETTQNADFEI